MDINFIVLAIANGLLVAAWECDHQYSVYMRPVVLITH